MNRRSFLRVLGAVAAAPLVAKLQPKAAVRCSVTAANPLALGIGQDITIISGPGQGHRFRIVHFTDHCFVLESAPGFADEVQFERSGLGSFPVDPEYSRIAVDPGPSRFPKIEHKAWVAS